MKVLTKALIKESEEIATKSGAFSFRELMGIAGNTAADIIRSRYNCCQKRIAVICGNGNNGGDGCVIARNLYEHGALVTAIFPLGVPVTENAAYYYEQLSPIKTDDGINDEYDIVIDALFGIGLNRPLDEELCRLIEKVNSLKAIKISVDIPSGVETDTGRVLGAAVKADLTVTFIALKPCFMLPSGSDYCGEVIVADIGVKPVAHSFLTTEKPHFEKRRHNSHKGTFGTALLICGSYGLAGAAILAAKASLRSGVGIAKCVVCDGIYPAFTSAIPEAVCVPSKQNVMGMLSRELDIKSLLTKASSLLFGCGVGVCEDTAAILESILENTEIPTVIDADGINILSRNIDILKKSKAPIILTPHPAEMARLCGTTADVIEDNRVKYARDFARNYNCTVILKGADTIIAEPDGEITFNLNGNPAMAKGGSGDVLAGILVSLLAQGLDLKAAARAAVFLHGEAGDKALSKRNERSVLASDIIEEL